MSAFQKTQPFMVLGSARTGSNYLSTLLNAHNNIKMMGELFNLDLLENSILEKVLTNPIDYLNNKISDNSRPEIYAVGFKLFYDHMSPRYLEKLISTSDADQKIKVRFDRFETYLNSNYDIDEIYSKFSSFWDFICNNKEINVIHLTRRNKLASLVSLKTAYISNEWLQLRGAKKKRHNFFLSYEECISYFKTIDDYEMHFASKFQHDQILSVTYEDLIENKDAELEKIFTFLNVSNRKSASVLQKQIVNPLSEIVLNFKELKQQFSTSAWEHFFYE
jgi:LPS sulfotransferase NodH